MRYFSILWVLSLTLFATCHAQVTGGVFSGEIRDGAGARIPGAQVQIVEQETGAVAHARSNEKGLFASVEMIPGTYLLTAAADGFSAETVGPVALKVNQTVRVDFRLELGKVSQTVVVEAGEAQQVSSQSAEVSQVVSREQVSGMPLNGRRWQQLITLSAGVTPGSPGETGSPNAVNIQGQRSKANLYMADGVPVTSSMQGRGNGFDIPLEAVREFAVQSGAYAADFGNVAGGVVNLQTRSGTGQWHGSLFEYLRNDALDAANFFSNATGQQKNPLRQNQFGGSIGGPVLRQRTFVFADYQGTELRSGAPAVATMPVEAQRGGDFSGLRNAQGAPTPIYDPFGASLARTPFPGNRIPVTAIDPAAANLTALLPRPNQFDASGQPLRVNNYAATPIASSGVKAFDIRLDHQLSKNQNLFFRHSFQDTHAAVPSLFGLPLGGTVSGAGSTTARGHFAALGHNLQISPTLLHEFRGGLNRQTMSLVQEDYGKNLSQQFGIPGVNRDATTSGLSTIVVSGLFNAGSSILTPLRLATTNATWDEKLVWMVGRHVVRFGTGGQYEMGSSGYRVFGRGFYSFLSLSTSSLVGPAGGDAFASFLVGSPLQILRDDYPPGMTGLRAGRAALFVQDDWRVTRRLTLNVGVRYDVMPYAREMHNRLANFDPATRTMLVAGQGTIPRLRETDPRNLAPRIGMAFAVRNDLVLRAGYGIGFIDPIGAAGVLNSMQFNIPFYARDNVTQFPYLAPQYRLSSQLPAVQIPSANAPSGDQRYLVPGDRNQYSQTWSFTLQKAWGSSLMLEAGYVGTSGNRLLLTNNINAAAPGTTAPAGRRPFGGALGEVRAFSNSGHSTYHGAQLRIEQRMRRGLYFLATYTWSKSIDNQSTGTDDSAAGGQWPQNPNNLRAERAPSNFDRTHRFSSSMVWDLPFAKRRFFGGWQLGGLYTLQSGAPFSVLMPCATVNAEGNNCRPNVLRDPAIPADQRSIQGWFDASAFALPTAAYGNAGRNLLRGPGSAVLDASLSKTFRFREHVRVTTRGDFFNAVNHANFGLPVHATDAPGIGTITAAGAGRVIQLGLRMEY